MTGSPRVLVIDNFDSFTFTLVDYLRRLGAEVLVERNDALSVSDVLAGGHDAIVVSPGPGTPEDAGISVALACACIEQSRPLLGVCLGHQAIAVACGSRVDRVAPVHGKAVQVTHDGTGLFIGVPSPFQAARYHSLAVPVVQAPLVANAWSDQGVVMALRHTSAPVHGVQFHPESIASDQGLALLRKFLATATRAPA